MKNKRFRIGVLTIILLFFTVMSIFSWIPNYMSAKSQFALCSSYEIDMNTLDETLNEWDDCIVTQGYFHNAQKISSIQMGLLFFLTLLSWKIDNLNKK